MHMSTHKISPALRGIVRLKERRIFACFYFCPECDGEWRDEALVVSDAYSPCCDAKASPYCVEEFTEDRLEFDLSEAA